MPKTETYLLSNTFPLSLIRRRVTIKPVPLEWVQEIAQSGHFESCWGHSNTLSVVNKLLGADITPKETRPVIRLDTDNLPLLYGQKFTKVIVVSPNYVEGFRPQVGEEVSEDKITGWQTLLVEFE